MNDIKVLSGYAILASWLALTVKTKNNYKLYKNPSQYGLDCYSVLSV